MTKHLDAQRNNYSERPTLPSSRVMTMVLVVKASIRQKSDDHAFLSDDHTFVRDNHTFVHDDRTFVCDDRTFVCDDRAFLSDDQAFVRDDHAFVRDDHAFPNGHLIKTRGVSSSNKHMKLEVESDDG